MGSRETRLSIRRLKTFESLKTPAYRVYYGSMVGQWAVMSMQMMVRSLLVYRVTGSAAAIGVIALAQAVPSVLVSLFGGAIADRIQKKHILIAGRAALAVFTLGIAFPLTVGYLSPEHPESWWLLIVSAVLQGTANGFTQPTLMAIIPEIVEKEQVMNAISLSTTGQYTFQLVGPAAAGYLIDAYGFATVWYIMAGMYIIAAIGTVFLPRSNVRQSSGRNILGDMAQGLHYIRHEATILLIVVFALCHVISGMSYQQLLPVFTDDILKVGASGLGILMSISAAGALLGSIVLASLPGKKRGVLLLLSGIIMGLGVVLFSYSRWWYLSLSIIPFIGLGPSMHSTMTATLVQSYVEPDYRGRMQSFVSMAQSSASLGTFLAGILSDAIGVQWAVGGMGLFLTLVSTVFIVFPTRLRKLE
jgi:MFS family permease